MDKDGFLKAFLEKWVEHDWQDVDGGDLHELCHKHGLSYERPATEEDCKLQWAQDWGVEVGDPIDEWHPEIKAILRTKQGA